MAKKSFFDGMYLSQLTPDVLLAFEQFVLPQALSGDYEALTRVCYVCGEAIKHGCALSPGLAKFVSDGLRSMADGNDAKEAWKIKRKPGQKNTALANHNACNRAFMVEMARQEGLTYEKAIDQVAQLEGVSSHTVEHAWKQHHHKITKTADGNLIMFAPPTEHEKQ